MIQNEVEFANKVNENDIGILGETERKGWS